MGWAGCCPGLHRPSPTRDTLSSLIPCKRTLAYLGITALYYQVNHQVLHPSKDMPDHRDRQTGTAAVYGHAGPHLSLRHVLGYDFAPESSSRSSKLQTLQANLGRYNEMAVELLVRLPRDDVVDLEGLYIILQSAADGAQLDLEEYRAYQSSRKGKAKAVDERLSPRPSPRPTASTPRARRAAKVRDYNEDEDEEIYSSMGGAALGSEDDHDSGKLGILQLGDKRTHPPFSHRK